MTASSFIPTSPPPPAAPTPPVLGAHLRIACDTPPSAREGAGRIPPPRRPRAPRPHPPVRSIFGSDPLTRNRQILQREDCLLRCRGIGKPLPLQTTGAAISGATGRFPRSAGLGARAMPCPRVVLLSFPLFSLVFPLDVNLWGNGCPDPVSRAEITLPAREFAAMRPLPSSPHPFPDRPRESCIPLAPKTMRFFLLFLRGNI